MGMYGNLLDPESEKMLRGQAMLQFGANLLGAQPTPYPQGTMGTIGQALGATLPMINQQAFGLAAMKAKQREAELEDARRREEAINRREDNALTREMNWNMLNERLLAQRENNAANLEMRKQQLEQQAQYQQDMLALKRDAAQGDPIAQQRLEIEMQRLDIERQKLSQGGERGTIGTVSPGDYTPESLDKYEKTRNFKDLVRYAPSLDIEGQGAVARAKKMGQTVGGAQGQAIIDIPKITQQAEYSNRLIDELISHPGFSASVGLKGPSAFMWGGKPIPGTPAAGFSERLGQIKGGQFLEAYQTLKGGGQITEVEGAKAEQAIARMGTAQDEEEFKRAAQDFKEIIAMGVDRAKRMAEGNFSPIGSAPSGPVQVQSPADVANLPSGTVFITPDGRRKVKP